MNRQPQAQGNPHARQSAALGASYAECGVSLRLFDPDRHLATLFAPRMIQPHLYALYAFNAEIARVRESVSEAMPGEIRLQWWRDALSDDGGDARNHPVALAVLDTIRRFNLPLEAFLALIDARSFDLYDDPMQSWGDLEGYCGETSSALIRLASIMLAGGEEPGSAALCGHAGVAYALTGLLRSFPLHARRRQCYLPQELLDACSVKLDDIFWGMDSASIRAALAETRRRARQHLAMYRAKSDSIDPRIAPAFYPVLLCEAYLERMERADYRPFESVIELAPLAKFWTLTKAAWRSRR